MAHIHEKIDFTVGVFIVYQNTVLLRMHDKYHIWLAVGGHVDDEWKWLTETQLEAMEGLLPDIKFYANLALKTLGE